MCGNIFSIDDLAVQALEESLAAGENSNEDIVVDGVVPVRGEQSNLNEIEQERDELRRKLESVNNSQNDTLQSLIAAINSLSKDGRKSEDEKKR